MVEKIVIEVPKDGEIERMKRITPDIESPNYTISMIRHTLTFLGVFEIHGRELVKVRAPPRSQGDLRKCRIVYPPTWQEFEDLYNDESILLALGDEPVKINKIERLPRRYFIDDAYPIIQRFDRGSSAC